MTQSTRTGLLDAIRSRRRFDRQRTPGDVPGALVFEWIRRVEKVLIEAIVGRFCVSQANDHLLVVDLSILPDFQGQGIGLQLIKSVQVEATRTNLPVKLSVELGNPARSFYEKLGFVIRNTGETHHALVWKPSSF